MKIQQTNRSIMLWWGSALLTSGIHIYLIWIMSNPFLPPTDTAVPPVAILLALSAEPEFTPNVQQDPVVGVSQDFNEPTAEPLESQPEAVSHTLTAPEHPDASLIVEKKVESPPQKRPQQKIITPRRPVSKPVAENSNNPPSIPAAVTSTPLSGESHQVAAAANSHSLQSQKSKMNWKSRLQGHLMGFKRYPPIARKQHQQGTAIIRFVVNKEGYVLSTMLIKSSGAAALDQEALAVIKRAQPLPLPPAELLSNGQVTLAMPVGFDLKNKKR
ncbi:energy transducer TonB [Yersinia artesiana]|uniref:energy transducer TonB n=1 Tax=Yersinia artesiana TaxID=2890315 RepID=UPI001583AD1F|nr:energy transducer TonB [Yersinia artesiana]